MGWFDEQIRQRKEHDDQIFDESFKDMAAAILGNGFGSGISYDAATDAAVEQILRSFLIKTKKVELPAEVKDFEESLEYRLKPYGVARRYVRLDEKWYTRAAGPMMGFLAEDDTPVALIPGKIKGYVFVNPQTGKKCKVNSTTCKLLSSKAICFYKPFPLKKLTVKDLAVYMFSCYSISDVVAFLASMAVMTLLGMVSPYLSKLLLSDVIESGSIRVLLAMAVFIVCVTLSRLLVSSVNSIINSVISQKQSLYVEAAVMNRIMSLKPGFFKEYSAGELAQRSDYMNNLCTTLISTITETCLTSLFSLLYIFQIFAFAPSLVAPALLVTLATVVFSVITVLCRNGINKKIMENSSKESGLSFSMINGIQKVKLAGAEKRMFAKWGRLYSESVALQYNPPLFLKLSSVISAAITLIGSIVIYYVAVGNHVTAAEYYAFNASYGFVSGAFMALAGLTASIAEIKPTLDMVKPILEAEPECAEDKKIVTSLKGNIEINHLKFAYSDNGPNVIDDLSLKISSGQYVAIVGQTGCGKSTLMRLLLGFETPTGGSIFYDGNDISRLDKRSLRRKIGTVMQDGKLFLGDIYSNIVITAPTLTLDEAWEAAEIANIAEDIRNMPMGMHTLISEGQGGVSGGQKQRLMIARAVANKPRILIFDEATSALDNITQKKVSEAIDSLKCTRIVIAHRLSTIKNCDRILVLDNGKIIEDGTYEELIGLNGKFAELVERQRVETASL